MLPIERRVAYRHLGKKYADEADVPEEVKNKAEELKDQQGYDAEKAYSVAWSIYCCKNPESDHCKKDQYFEGQPAICEGIQENN